MAAELEIGPLLHDDPRLIGAAFEALGWNKPPSLFEGYLAQQTGGDRSVLVARSEGRFVGYATLTWHSPYPPFARAGVPEIQDLNILPPFRRQGFGSRLMDDAERLVAQRADRVGVGVGLYGDYGPAQRLYVRRGYVPDGLGLAWNGRTVRAMSQVVVDDELVLYFTKVVRS